MKEKSATATTTAGDSPWRRTKGAGSSECLHLTLLWSFDEPERIGETTSLGSPCIVGRGKAGAGDEQLPRAGFVRSRPGQVSLAGPLTSRRISRAQLECSPASIERVRVRNRGRAPMLRNDFEVSDDEFVDGDVLTIKDAAVFLVERRPRVLAVGNLNLNDYADFPFGMTDPHGIIGESAAAWHLREELAFAARADCHVLITGESGVGKELAAQAVHSLSVRKNGPFVSRSAATFPDTLIDAELFGSAKHFPNAGSPERPGLVGQANGGVLFLDEIGDLPEPQQAHLLRVLDGAGDYQRLGEAQTRSSDFRLYAATNRPVSTLKPDFLARFGVHVKLPGLEQRRSDIPLLARGLLQEFPKSPDGKALRADPELISALVRHEYFTHVRELHRLLRMAASGSSGEWLNLTDSIEEALKLPADAADAITEQNLIDALRAAKGSKVAAARRLGLKNRFVLYRLMRKFGISADSEPSVRG